MEYRPHFILLHSACGDSRKIMISVEHIVAIHGSFDVNDATEDEMCYETTVVIMDAAGQDVHGGAYRSQSGGVFKVNEDLDTIWEKIATAYQYG